MIEVTTVEFRVDFSEKVNQAAYAKQNIILTRRGKPIAAMISLAEYEEYMAYKHPIQD